MVHKNGPALRPSRYGHAWESIEFWGKCLVSRQPDALLELSLGSAAAPNVVNILLQSCRSELRSRRCEGRVFVKVGRRSMSRGSGVPFSPLKTRLLAPRRTAA